MARKLKTFMTTSGFFELAVAAPSMKAASELLGVNANAFSQGFAHETDDGAVIAATMESPGVVLRRAVGTKGRFSETPELPKLSALQDAIKLKHPAEPRHAQSTVRTQKSAKPKKVNTAVNRNAVKLHDLAEKRREREERRAEAQRAKDRERRERATEKAQAALDEARTMHEARVADIRKQREALARKAILEEEDWEKDEEKLKAALRSAEDG